MGKRKPKRHSREIAAGSPDHVLLLALLGAVSIVFIWSGIGPYHRSTWWMEVAPAIIGVAILAAVYPRFRFSRLVYVLVAIHCVILMVGGHYTYAKVPLFDVIKDLFHLARNHYDRLGHLAQGFIPAILAREVLLRTSPLKPGKWLFFLIVCVCLAFSAFYEFVEWWAAVLLGSGADQFLGTQGDEWDTQWDMFMAFIGSILSLTLLSRLHDQSMRRLEHDEGRARRRQGSPLVS